MLFHCTSSLTTFDSSSPCWVYKARCVRLPFSIERFARRFLLFNPIFESGMWPSFPFEHFNISEFWFAICGLQSSFMCVPYFRWHYCLNRRPRLSVVVLLGMMIDTNTIVLFNMTCRVIAEHTFLHDPVISLDTVTVLLARLCLAWFFFHILNSVVSLILCRQCRGSKSL